MISLPITSVSLSDKGQRMVIYNVEQIEDKYLLTFKDEGGAFFLLSDEEYKKGQSIKVAFDIKAFDFYQENELKKPHLNIDNEIIGMAYYHKEKGEDGKKEKVLDYLIDDEEFSCHNPIAYRTFITNNDRALYSIDLAFRFNAYQIHLDENGPLEVKPLEILKYEEEQFLLCEYKDTKLIIHMENEQVDLTNPLKVSIDIDDMQVFDYEKNIRLV